MDQITKTVNQVLAFVVGVGLICFTTFILLMASAQLNNSPVGDRLAELAGETARTARTDSLAYWGRVGSEVVVGLGFGSPIQAGGSTVNTGTGTGTGTNTGTGTTTNPIVIPTAAPRPTTPPPVAGVRSTDLSEAALLLWRGIDSSGQLLPLGVSLENVQNQTRLALERNSGDAMARWLWGRLQTCAPAYNQMVQADYRDVVNAPTIQAASRVVLQTCNPRILEAYARDRWATLALWTASAPLDEAQAARVLAGLAVVVGNKMEGPARGDLPQDMYEVTVQGVNEFKLAPITIRLSVATLTQLLGEQWRAATTPIRVPGEFLPTNLPEPALPTEADLGVVAQPPAPQADVQASADAPPAGGNPKVYEVQAGDTLMKIARANNLTLDQLLAANPGINPNIIIPGQKINLP